MFSKNSADLFKSILAPSASTTTQHEEGFYLCTCFKLLHRDSPSGAYLTSREIPGFLDLLVDSHLCWVAEDNSKIPDCPGQQLGEGDWQWGLCSPATMKRWKGSLLKNKIGSARSTTLDPQFLPPQEGRAQFSSAPSLTTTCDTETGLGFPLH